MTFQTNVTSFKAGVEQNMDWTVLLAKPAEN